MPMVLNNRHVVSVSNLNEKIKHLIESTFVTLLVRGEVSRPTYHSSGHLYFTLKDSQSSIRCVMFKSAVARMLFRLEEGMEIVVDGRITLYKPRGDYQIQVESIILSGEGSLAIVYEKLKEELKALGYFEKRRAIPKYVERIAIVTSKSSAALQDMLRVASKRWALVKIYVIDSLTQGQNAPAQIAQAIAKADNLKVDAIILARGGGSVEDLWCFNERLVAEAIFKAKTPIVSAIGHEIDFVISDFVADLRAPTPSASMEMILPDMNEVLMLLDELKERFSTLMSSKMHGFERLLDELLRHMRRDNFSVKIDMLAKELDSLEKLLTNRARHLIESKSNELPHLKSSLSSLVFANIHNKEQSLNHIKPQLLFNQNRLLNNKQDSLKHLRNRLELLNPSHKLLKNSAQIIKENRAVSLQEVGVDDVIKLADANYLVEAKVISKKEVH